jgi:hypothetical protein
MPYAIDRKSVTDTKFDTNSTRIRHGFDRWEWYFEKHGNGNVQFASVSEITLVKSKNLFGDS